MANSPSINKDRILSWTIYCQGKQLTDNYGLVSAEVEMAFNRVGRAKLRLRAGDMDAQSFDESDDDLVKPGNTIRFDLGDVNSEVTVFEGYIVDLRLLVGRDQHSQMELDCRDYGYPLTQGRRNQIFEQKSDSDIIKEVLKNYGSSKVDSTTFEHPTMVQYYCSDWDFLLSRARAAGMVVNSSRSSISVTKPDVSTSAVLTVTFGTDLISFNGALSCDGQFADYRACSWDSSKESVVKATSTAPKLNQQGPSSTIKHRQKQLIQSDALINSTPLKDLINSEALVNGLSRYRGSFSFYGSATVVLGSLVELKGMGEQFNGVVYVGAVKHLVENNEWITEVGMGLPTPEVEMNHRQWLPSVAGLHLAVVKKLDGDPDKENRILIELPWLDGTKKELWARIATPYATSDSGLFFMPEPRDQVVIGFVDQDPRHPIIVGSLHSEKHKPPAPYTAENNKKAIVSREKMTIEFDEKNKVITLHTPGENSIQINDKDKSITLKDQHKNEMTMDSSGITINSAKDINLKAKGAITLDATSKIALNAKTDITAEALNVKLTAKVGLAAKGNATAELSASGQTVVKGAIVMIN